jgi:hypothetical protein
MTRKPSTIERLPDRYKSRLSLASFGRRLDQRLAWEGTPSTMQFSNPISLYEVLTDLLEEDGGDMEEVCEALQDWTSSALDSILEELWGPSDFALACWNLDSHVSSIWGLRALNVNSRGYLYYWDDDGMGDEENPRPVLASWQPFDDFGLFRSTFIECVATTWRDWGFPPHFAGIAYAPHGVLGGALAEVFRRSADPVAALQELLEEARDDKRATEALQSFKPESDVDPIAAAAVGAGVELIQNSGEVRRDSWGDGELEAAGRLGARVFDYSGRAKELLRGPFLQFHGAET